MDEPVTLRWLGVAGIELGVRGRTLLLDPFVSRPSLRRLWLGRTAPDRALVAEKIPACDAALVTHAHWDHLMDVPEVARRTGAAAYGSANACQLLSALGMPKERLHELAAGDSLRLESPDAEVDVLPAEHGRILGRPIFTGPVRDGLRPPLRLRDYRMDDDFSFLLRLAGFRLLDWSSERAEGAVAADVLFVKPFGTRAFYEALLGAVRPRLIIPIHWDDFFRPLSRPLRPSFAPPAWSLPPLRRVDLTAFARLVRQLAPSARVFMPAIFHRYGLGDLLRAPDPERPHAMPGSQEVSDGD